MREGKHLSLSNLSRALLSVWLSACLPPEACLLSLFLLGVLSSLLALCPGPWRIRQ